MCKLQLVLVLLLIGRENGTRYILQSDYKRKRRKYVWNVYCVIAYQIAIRREGVLLLKKVHNEMIPIN